MQSFLETIGPTSPRVHEKGTVFRVWAPRARGVDLLLGEKNERCIPMEKEAFGYWCADAAGVGDGERYRYELDGKTPRPDPASLFQPDGVHAASAVVDTRKFAVTPLETLPKEELIFYELHVGTFTPEGTFQAAAERLPYLRELGITAVELMPIAAFPGERNWGYDGVYPYAVQTSYGGPEGLARFVDRCHREGIAVFLDVVYNHLGPEGNYLRDFAPYFTKKYTTPWGEAVNFDDAHSYGVRKYFIDNALHWFDSYDIDGLRIDAVHGIFDMSAKHFLRELAEKTADYSRQTGKKRYLVAESDLNDRRVIDPPEEDGYGLDAQWLEDFHHAVHALLTGEKRGYYTDFGTPDDLKKSLEEGFVYGWRFSRYRQRFFGSDTSDIAPSAFIAFIQNHDQVGNRPGAERLASLLKPDELGLAAGLLLLSPYQPLLFMGEEYGEEAPFHYFIHHGDPGLVEAVRRGRKRELRRFRFKSTFHDPQSETTFRACKLAWGRREQPGGKHLLALYRTLLRFRKEHPVYRKAARRRGVVSLERRGELLTLLLRSETGEAVAVLYNLGRRRRRTELPRGAWQLYLDSDTFPGGGAASDEKNADKIPPNIAPKSFLLLDGEMP